MSDRPDSTELEATLWRSAHDEKPSAQVRESALAAALAAGGVGGGGGGTSNPPPAPGAAATAKGVALGWKLAAALAVALGAAAIVVATQSPESHAPAAVTPVSAPPTTSAVLEVAPAAPIAAAEVPSSEPSAAAARPAPPAASAAPAAPAPAPAPRVLTLADEIVAIDAARASLDRGDTTGALRSLEGYDKTFPHGALAPEAAALRARAKKALATVDAGAP